MNEIVFFIVAPVDVVYDLSHAGSASDWSGHRVEGSQVVKYLRNHEVAVNRHICLKLFDYFFPAVEMLDTSF